MAESVFVPPDICMLMAPSLASRCTAVRSLQLAVIPRQCCGGLTPARPLSASSAALRAVGGGGGPTPQQSLPCTLPKALSGTPPTTLSEYEACSVPSVCFESLLRHFGDNGPEMMARVHGGQ